MEEHSLSTLEINHSSLILTKASNQTMRVKHDATKKSRLWVPGRTTAPALPSWRLSSRSPTPSPLLAFLVLCNCGRHTSVLRSMKLGVCFTALRFDKHMGRCQSTLLHVKPHPPALGSPSTLPRTVRTALDHHSPYSVEGSRESVFSWFPTPQAHSQVT